MWGCIGLAGHIQRSKGVPSLYVRVYRKRFRRNKIKNCSLTIREGVSRRQIVGKTEAEFPHYTWGCIDELKIKLRVLFVSSLYVRVYHLFVLSAIGITGSLTIREGVSARRSQSAEAELFPHYTWGCIVQACLFYLSRIVPSLYVRVYHNAADGRVWQLRSLIIREGVSSGAGWICLTVRFPHYIWGCIDWKKAGHFTSIVPSLYVRVY